MEAFKKFEDSDAGKKPAMKPARSTLGVVGCRSVEEK
jgi:hypothetical protein